MKPTWICPLIDRMLYSCCYNTINLGTEWVCPLSALFCHDWQKQSLLFLTRYVRNRWKLLQLFNGNRLGYGYVESSEYVGWNLTKTSCRVLNGPSGKFCFYWWGHWVHTDWTFAWRPQNRYFALGSSILITFGKSRGGCVRELIAEMHDSDIWYYTDRGYVRLLTALPSLMLIQNSCKLKAFDH